MAISDMFKIHLLELYHGHLFKILMLFFAMRGVNNKNPWLHFAFPGAILSKQHLLPFPRISQNTTWLRLEVFWLIPGNSNSCNFAQYPTQYMSKIHLSCASLNFLHTSWDISKIRPQLIIFPLAYNSHNRPPFSSKPRY